MMSKLESIMNFIEVILNYSTSIKDKNIKIYYLRNYIVISPNGLSLTIKLTTLEFLLKEYNSMDEISFILTHGRDPFSLMDNFDILMNLFAEVKDKVGI